MIKIPVEVGDIILVGRWRNKPIEVKKIGTDEWGHPTINGKPILKIRLQKFMKKDANMNVKKIAEEILTQHQNVDVGKKFVCTKEGVIETLTGEARSADVKVGDVFTVIRKHSTGLGYEGTLSIKGLWSHEPGLSGRKTDPTPRGYKFTVLLRNENIKGDSDFFAQFKEA
jgi:hypothetical protein